jgi:phosphoglycolate phosphatase-like HAD superfamily hydrolase
MVKVWGLEPASVLFVGDSADDMKCGNAAGMKTVLFDPESKKPHLHSLASIVVQSMADLQQHLTVGVQL